MKLSETLNRDVVCKADSSLIGSTADVYFDGNCRNIVYFDVACAGGKTLLPFSAVASVADALMTDDALALTSRGDADLSPLVSSPIGKKVYTGTGRFKGAVSDVVFSAKGRVSAVVADGVSYSPSSFRAFGDVWLLKDSASGRRNTPKVPFPKAKSDYKATILGDSEAVPPRTAKLADAAKAADAADGKSPTGAATEEDGRPVFFSPVQTNIRPDSPAALDVRPAEEESETHVYLRDAAGRPEVIFGDDGFTPHRVIADYNFLLGRTLADDLFSYSGEKLASRGMRVTVDLVETARRHGKLMELTLSSK
mgnify:CR=1 FL=1